MGLVMNNPIFNTEDSAFRRVYFLRNATHFEFKNLQKENTEEVNQTYYIYSMTL